MKSLVFCLVLSPSRYEELLKQGLQLAEALQYMHNDAMPGKMVIHRDLKPDNIGFDADGNLKLIDLGLGRVRGEERKGEIVHRAICPCAGGGLLS